MLEFEGVKYFTVAETAERLNLSEQTIRRWIRVDRLKAAKLGRSYMVSIDSIRSLITKEE
jgi:excisionase family DNA binding protein